MKRVLILALAALAGGFASCEEDWDPWWPHCNEDTYVVHCDGNKSVTCEGGYIRSSDCGKYGCSEFSGQCRCVWLCD